jgi:hypothetical protein
MKKAQSMSRANERRKATQKESSLRSRKRQEGEDTMEIKAGNEIVAARVDLSRSSRTTSRPTMYVGFEAIAGAMGITPEEARALIEDSRDQEG